MSQQHLQSDIKTILKEIFASLIVGISAEELDVHANIFDLGLDSIALMEIRGAIKEKLGVNISLRSMLENGSRRIPGANSHMTNPLHCMVPPYSG